jgi:hypothetical protein
MSMGEVGTLVSTVKTPLKKSAKRSALAYTVPIAKNNILHISGKYYDNIPSLILITWRSNYDK